MYTREQAEHFCPPSPNAERTTPVTALSRLAFFETMVGFLPPISTTTGLGNVVANSRYTCLKPTSYEPVKVMPSTCGFVTISLPTVRPGPVTKLTTPAGMPASMQYSMSLYAVHGASDEGFSTTVLPVTSAAATGPAASASGKLNGEITAHTPYGLSTLMLTSVSPKEFISRTNPLFSRIWKA